MTLSKFIKKYDQDGSVILLEGKRTVKEEDKNKLIQLGKLIAEKTSNIIFRSGNAEGADYYFSKGVASVAPERLQVIIPYSGHREKQNFAYETYSIDDAGLVAESEVVYQSKHSKKMESLIDKYIAGDVNKNTIKAAYILRDTMKVLGSDEIPPATFGIFYEDLDKPESGGTGHTMKVCQQNKVPYIDQRVWMKWL